MWNYIWPIGLIVLSNIFYHITTKTTPHEANAFLSLTVTYLVGAVASGLLFLVTGNGANLLQEYGRLNWAPFVLGLVILGLEAGWIYAYKAGWPVSTAFIVQSAILAGFLLAVGYVLYREPLAWNKVAGVVICLIGLYVINYK